MYSLRGRHARYLFIGEALVRNAEISMLRTCTPGSWRIPCPAGKGASSARQRAPAPPQSFAGNWYRHGDTRGPNSIQRAKIQLWARTSADGKRRKSPAAYLANRVVDYMAMINSWAVRLEILR